MPPTRPLGGRFGSVARAITAGNMTAEASDVGPSRPGIKASGTIQEITYSICDSRYKMGQTFAFSRAFDSVSCPRAAADRMVP